MPVHTIQDLFHHELGDMYDAEQQILNTLEQMERETRNDMVRDRIRQHRDETRQHVENLERCFDLMGVETPKVKCAAIRGLQAEKKDFDRENPSDAAREVFNLDAADKTEHYEIAGYRALIDQAEAMGNTEVRDLLRQNLRQEEEMSRWIEEHQPRLIREFGQQG